jgi:pre-mRNA branch site protein p14
LTSEEYYDIFGKYGAIRQIRRGVSGDTRGTAYVIYEDVYDAKHALEQLQGFNVKGRYIVVLYHQITRIQPNLNAAAAAQQQAAATSSVNPYL